MIKKKVYTSTGRRKSSIARIKMTPGKGKIIINNKDAGEYLPFEALLVDLTQPLVLTKTNDKVDIEANVKGGGFSGQVGAIRLAIAKVLLEYDSSSKPGSEDSFRSILKKKGLLSRDQRIKERKKYGLKKARRAPQFSKR